MNTISPNAMIIRLRKPSVAMEIDMRDADGAGILPPCGVT
jgi:hypothetical protein